MEVVARTFQFNQNIGIQAKDHEKKKHYKNTWLASVNDLSLVPGQLQNRPCLPPEQTPGHLTFLKIFFKFPGMLAV